MSLLAIIPARGGSKRIPRKNVAPFLGRPILAYSIAAAQQAGIYDGIHVSTEDAETAAIAASLGCAPDFMRGAHFDDHASVLSVGRWVLEQYASRGQHFDNVGFISACAPLTDGEDLRLGYRAFLANERQPQIAVSDYPAPPQQSLLLQADGRLAALDQSAFLARSQDLAHMVFDTGSFAFFPAERLTSGESFNDVSYRGYLLPRHKAVDVNVPEDLAFAEILYRGARSRSEG